MASADKVCRLHRLPDGRCARLSGQGGGVLKSASRSARYACYGCGSPDKRSRKTTIVRTANERVLVPASKNPLFFCARGIIAAAKGQVKTLSGERIQKEMLRVLGADDPAPVLRTMAACGVLAEVLPGTLQFERFQRLCTADADYFFVPDGLLRLGRRPTPSDEVKRALHHSGNASQLWLVQPHERQALDRADVHAGARDRRQRRRNDQAASRPLQLQDTFRSL